MTARIASLASALLLAGCAAGGGRSAGEGGLAPCPPTPNCVSSLDPDPARAVPPLRWKGTADGAREALRAVLGAEARAGIVEERDPWWRAEFRSAVFGFVDDVEFLFDDAAKTVHVRSASRVGYSDLGVNRRRVERIRAAWESRAP